MPADRDLARTWQGVLGRLQFDVSPHSFSTWLQPTTPLGFDGDTLLVRTPFAFHLAWLQKQFGTVLRRALIGEVGRDVDLRFVGDNEQPAPARTADAPPPAPRGVNTSLTFASYMPSCGNEPALQACRDLSGHDGCTPISPILIWGAPGLGKTHLLHATANRAIEHGERVVVLTGEEFANGYQDSIRATNVGAFRDEVRSATLFILDDLQGLVGYTGTQKQLRETIDSVTNRGGHVVLASETHPRSLNLVESLASRIYGGLVVGMGEILPGERRAFVEHTARNHRASMPPWCVERIAAFPTGSPREIKGVVHRAINLDRCGRLAEEALDQELAQTVITAAARRAMTPEAIIEAVASCFETTGADICGRSRKGGLREARAVAMAALADSGRSLSQIGALIGKRDPSTVSPLVEKGRALLAGMPEVRAKLAG